MCFGDQKGKVFFLFSQGQDSSLASQVKGKGREEGFLNYSLQVLHMISQKCHSVLKLKK